MPRWLKNHQLYQSTQSTDPTKNLVTKRLIKKECHRPKMKAAQLTNSESRLRFNKSQSTSTSGARHLACHSRHAVGTVFRWPNGTVENGRFERKSGWRKTPLAPFFWKTSHKILLPVSLVGTGKLVLKETWKNQSDFGWMKFWETCKRKLLSVCSSILSYMCIRCWLKQLIFPGMQSKNPHFGCLHLETGLQLSGDLKFMPQKTKLLCRNHHLRPILPIGQWIIGDKGWFQAYKCQFFRSFFRMGKTTNSKYQQYQSWQKECGNTSQEDSWKT